MSGGTSMTATSGSALRNESHAGAVGQPLVSIGIPSYNRAEGLRRVLRQVLVQTYKNLEVIVSDDASPDPGVFEVAREFAERDPRVRAIRHDVNLGAVRNHDYCLGAARGKYFAWVHDDDELPAEYVEKCVEALESDANLVLVGPKCDRFLEDRPWMSYAEWSSVGQTTFRRLRDLARLAYHHHSLFEQYLSGVFVRRSLPARMSSDFKSQMHLFFHVSAYGSIGHVPSITLRKNTTHRNLDGYATGSMYRRHRWLAWFRDDVPRSIQQSAPITWQMLGMTWRSSQLSLIEKLRLAGTILRLFVQRSVLYDLKRAVTREAPWRPPLRSEA